MGAGAVGDERGARPQGLASPGRAVRACLIVNPLAGLGLWPGPQPAIERLVAAGWQVDVQRTQQAGHAVELTRQAVARGDDVVIGCGGDGTLNEIMQALVGTPTALGVIPLGTANVLAREMGVPLDPLGAAGALLGGRVERIDVGYAGERAFLMMAGIGLDADVVREYDAAPRRPPRWLKAPLLFAGTIQRFFTYRGTRMRLRIDGVSQRGRVMMVVVGNIKGYAGVLQIAHEAEWHDGLLDVVIFYDAGLIERIGNVLTVLVRRHKGRRGVSYARARQVTVWTAQPVPVQADGDIVGETPMTFSIAERALRLLLPSARPGGQGPAGATGRGDRRA